MVDRRSALAMLGIGLLAGCGGGGGAAGGVAQGVSTSGGGAVQDAGGGDGGAAAPIQALSRNIACWGDSITDLYAGTLQQASPDRQVYNGGIVGQTSMQIAARQVADSERESWISVFWYGHNNWGKDQVKADLATSIAALAPGNRAFVVLSMLNWAGSGNRGTWEYAETLRVNGELAALYPDNYIDIRSHLVGLASGSWQDQQDLHNDVLPSSLRFDAIHLNDAGCRAVAGKLQEFLAAKGW